MTAPTFPELVRLSARIGCLSFGGPAGQIALMHREIVEERGWVDEDAIPPRAQLLPPAARTRGAAAGHLDRLEAARGERRTGGGAAVRHSRRAGDPGAVAALCAWRPGWAGSRRCSWGSRRRCWRLSSQALLRMAGRALKHAVQAGAGGGGVRRAVLAVDLPFPLVVLGAGADRAALAAASGRTGWR